MILCFAQNDFPPQLNILKITPKRAALSQDTEDPESQTLSTYLQGEKVHSLRRKAILSPDSQRNL